MTDQVSMTVLVIDDDAHIRSSIGKFLIARGHTVIETADGEKGVEVVESQAFERFTQMNADKWRINFAHYVMSVCRATEDAISGSISRSIWRRTVCSATSRS